LVAACWKKRWNHLIPNEVDWLNVLVFP